MIDVDQTEPKVEIVRYAFEKQQFVARKALEFKLTPRMIGDTAKNST